MALHYAIHPSIGVARVGNSPNSFYLAPDTIGGLPIECDECGNALLANNAPKNVESFRDGDGYVRRQGARFRLFVFDDSNPSDPGRELTLDDPKVRAIEWTVHLANKKACWYPFRVFVGDVMFPRNTYKDQGIGLRNPDVKGPEARQKLIIDPGPRRVSGRKQNMDISRYNIPADYPHASFPERQPPLPIDALGEVRTDDQGRLVVLGGFGHASGQNNIVGLFEGAGWYDDVSDGQVTCKVVLQDQTAVLLNAWVIVAAPKFAPELVNIITLDDIMFDLGVRSQALVPELYDPTKGWNPNYPANFERDIAPIFDRIAGYIWVANVPSMVRLAAPRFDLADRSERNRPNRENVFRYFRRPFGQGNEIQTLMSDNGVPLLPLNSATNSFMNVNIDKFMALTETQYFLMSQWACGTFTTDAPPAGPAGVHPLDRSSVGNCVGDPMGPGIEVTWNTRNPVIYEGSYRIKPRFKDESHYIECGLSANEYDETVSGEGCEPGDLTKRMSIPWQADFSWCTVQHVNFVDPDVCVNEQFLPVPPTYFVYWWPPQSPVQVISGAMTIDEQRLAGIDAGIQVNFSRGINNYTDMIIGWSYLGFILNQNHGPDRAQYPYFVETSRKHDEFIVGSVAVGDPSNANFATDTTFMPVWFMKNRNVRKKPRRLQAGTFRGT
ncbi:MAG: CTQ-dependent lysine 6-oxidase LodA [Candidatus Acidiferrales bacterium]